MPSWKLHKWIDKLLTGKEHPDVHWFLDTIGVILNKGEVKGHRKVWGHSPEFLALVYLLTNDEKKLLSAIAHQILDEAITYEEGKILELLINILKKYGKNNP